MTCEGHQEISHVEWPYPPLMLHADGMPIISPVVAYSFRISNSSYSHRGFILLLINKFSGYVFAIPLGELVKCILLDVWGNKF